MSIAEHSKMLILNFDAMLAHFNTMWYRKWKFSTIHSRCTL